MPVKKGGKANINSSTLSLTTLGILIAAEVVLTILEIHTGFIKINFAFIPVAVSAYLFGALGGVVVYGIGDIVGCIVHPVGAWYPPITLTYLLMGAVFGLFLKRKRGIVRIISSAAINQLLVSLFVTTLWISILQFGSSENPSFPDFYFTMVAARLVPAAIIAAAEMLILPPVLKAVDRIPLTRSIPPLFCSDKERSLADPSAEKADGKKKSEDKGKSKEKSAAAKNDISEKNKTNGKKKAARNYSSATKRNGGKKKKRKR